MTANHDKVRETVTAAGFIVAGDFGDPAGVPDPFSVWKKIVSQAAKPTVSVPDNRFEEIDEVWLRLATENGTIGADGHLLLSVGGAGRLPWLPVRVGDTPPRATSVLVVGRTSLVEFVAMAPDGSAYCAVTTEEDETWVFATPAPYRSVF